MDFRELIVLGEERYGSRQELAERLGIHPDNLTNAKRGARGLPDRACVELGMILGIQNPLAVIAARNAAQAKTEAERRFWELYVGDSALYVQNGINEQSLNNAVFYYRR
jgi:hypothetical protein